jgi:uncharacterized radical SAM protein YgiQ
VFIGSGIRHDLLVGGSREDRRRNRLDEYTRALVRRHVSGRLKVAPEHTSDPVLRLMRKPSFRLFEEFKKRFDDLSREAGLAQELVPYFISGHPGCTREDMADLARRTERLGYRLEQVQEFTPTPMTLATVLYWTGMDPATLKPVTCARTREEKAEQRSFFFRYMGESRSGGVPHPEGRGRQSKRSVPGKGRQWKHSEPRVPIGRRVRGKR